jgi:hypothetical protein
LRSASAQDARRRRQTADGRCLYAKFHDIAAQLVSRDPVNTVARHQLDLADQKLCEAQAVTDHEDLALPSCELARDAQLAIAAHDPSDQDIRIDLAQSWTDIGDIEHDRGDTAASIAAFRAALALQQSFVDQAPTPPWSAATSPRPKAISPMS